MKAAVVHHIIIQKEVDELLAKDAVEPWMGGAGFNWMYLMFLGSLVANDQYSALNDLIALCTYLLLRFLLSDYAFFY